MYILYNYVLLLQIIELTGCAQEKAEIAMFDSKNDMERAVNHVLEGGTDEVKSSYRLTEKVSSIGRVIGGHFVNPPFQMFGNQNF